MITFHLYNIFSPMILMMTLKTSTSWTTTVYR